MYDEIDLINLKKERRTDCTYYVYDGDIIEPNDWLHFKYNLKVNGNIICRGIAVRGRLIVNGNIQVERYLYGANIVAVNGSIKAGHIESDGLYVKGSLRAKNYIEVWGDLYADSDVESGGSIRVYLGNFIAFNGDIRAQGITSGGKSNTDRELCAIRGGIYTKECLRVRGFIYSLTNIKSKKIKYIGKYGIGKILAGGEVVGKTQDFKILKREEWGNFIYPELFCEQTFPKDKERLWWGGVSS